MSIITSTSNSQIKEIVKLQKQSRARKKSKSFIVEGFKMLGEAAKHNLLKKIYISETVYERNSEYNIEEMGSVDVNELLQKFEYEIVSDNVFKEMSDTVTTQGILGITAMPSYTREQILNDDRHMWIMLDNLRDPGNLGTIMRTAEGADMSGVIISKESVDLFNPKVVRSTMGAIFRVPFIYEETLTEIIQEIQQKGFPVYATAMKGSEVYDKVDYTGGAAIVIGNEANGVSEEVLSKATGNIRIPMAGELESLNAAVSAAIVMYETARQRRGFKNLTKT